MKAGTSGCAVLLLSALSAFMAHAARTPGISMGDFGAAVPSSERNAVFSPFAFEVACAAISEAFGPIEKAKFVEHLGALVGYENVYRPLIARYRDAQTNDFALVSGRAFLSPSLRSFSTKYRTLVQTEYAVQVCPFRPNAEGAESFLKAAVDGGMEDFRLPESVISVDRVSFADLECFRCHWAEPFPTENTRRLAFSAADGRKTEIEAIVDLRPAELWQTDRFTMLRLPMTDGSFFHAVLPAEGVPLAAIRGEFAGGKLDTALVVIRSITEAGIYRGPVAVVLPKFALDSTIDLAPAFHAAGLPTGGFKNIDQGEGVPFARVFQRMRFAIDEGGPFGLRLARKSAEDETRAGKTTRRFVGNRPFLFFVHHEPTRTIPVAGIYTGVDK